MNLKKIKEIISGDNFKQIAKYLLLVFGSIFIVFVIFKLTLPKLINANTNRAIEGLLPVVVLFLTIMAVNKLLFAFSLEWIKRILMNNDGFMSYFAPITGDLKVRNYYAAFQYELGNEFTFPGFVGILPVIGSLISAGTMLNLFRVIAVEGIEYFTDELGLAFLLTLIAYVLLLNTRALAISGIISSCKNRVYMSSIRLYTLLPSITSAIWFLYFVVAILIPPLRGLVQIPIINLIAILIPILVLSGLEYHGIKQVSKDITSRYDMESVLKNTRNQFYKANYNSNSNQGYVSPEYQEYQGYNNYQDQGYEDYQNQGYLNQGNNNNNHYQDNWWNN